MPLPPCECVNGLPIQQQLGNIYCALYTLAQGGGGGITFPLSPTQGGTGVANGAGETITLNGGFALQLTLTGATNVTLPTSGVIQVFDQSLNMSDPAVFNQLTITQDVSFGSNQGSLNGDGSVTCSGTSGFHDLTFGLVGGVAPAPDGTYALVTSITITNGIITAIS